jgi:hypothetical protein
MVDHGLTMQPYGGDQAKIFWFPLEYLDEFLNFWDIFQADSTSGSG